MTNLNKTCLTRVLPAPFVLGGLFLLFYGGRGLMLAHESPNWPTQQGQILISTIDTTFSSGGGDSVTSSTSYHPVVVYAYTVDAVRYEGKRITFGDHATEENKRAQDIIAEYPTGSIIEVFYKPQSPSTSVLIPGISNDTFFVPGFGLVSLLVGFLIIFLSRLEGVEPESSD